MSIIKKLKKIFFVLTCLVLSVPKILGDATLVQGAQATDQEVQQTLNLAQQAPNYAQQIADALFNPVYHGVSGQTGNQAIKDGTPNPYPTTSLNEKAVDATFGASGINLDATTVRYIKNFYFYLEYATKIERAAYLAALALQTNLTDNKNKPTDFFTLLRQGGWSALMSALEKKYGTAVALLQAIRANVKAPSWSSISNSIQATSWQDIVTTDFWKAIPITQNDIIQSIVWQEYLKYMITRSFSHDNSLIASLTQVQSNIFRFIPDIEVAYYHPDYSHLRYSAELFGVNLILTANLRNRLLVDCTQWSQYLDPTTKQAHLQNTYNATQSYAQTPFYLYLSSAAENFEETIVQASEQEIKITPSLAQEPLIQERLTVLGMIKSLQALTQPMYSLDKLNITLQTLNNRSITKPVPNFILHAADDYFLLEDRAATIQALTQAATQVTTSSPTALTTPSPIQPKPKSGTVKTQSLFHALNSRTDQKHFDTVIVQSFFGDLWNAIEEAAQSVFHAAESLGEAVASIALKVGAALEGIFDKDAAQKLEQASNTLMRKAKADFETSYQETQQTISDVAQTAEDITDGFGKGLAFIFGKIDPQLGKDIEGAFDAIADAAIENIANLTHVAVATEAGIVRLSLDAVSVASDIILGGLEAAETDSWKQFSAQLGSDAKALGEDIVTSILDVVTLAVKEFTDELKNLVKFAAYMVSVLTDVFIDISKGITLLATGLADIFGANLDPSQVAGQVGAALDTHRRTINAVITTGLMIAAVVLTDGAAIPAIAMIGGQQVFQIVGGYQQDQMQAEQLKEEKQFISDFQIFVDHNEVIAQEQQITWSDELDKKYQAEITNQERHLGFYQNYLNQTFNNYQNQMAEQLGNYLAPQLEPDKKYNTVYADVGSLYGFATGVYEFNPSQGFSLYNKGRNTYSQEIAVFPALEDEPHQPSTGTTIENIPSKFWFIQQETYPLATATNSVEVRLRAIYVLTTYHIGLYFGGKQFDIASIIKNKVAPIDAGHLAKMLVFRKIDASKPAIIGLYQHESLSLDESKNWLYQAPEGQTNFQVGAWYTMKMNMSNPTTLQFKVWKDGDAEPGWQQVTVQAQTDPLTTLGIIASGASVEYQIISPQPKPTIVKDAQGNALRNAPTMLEKDREIAAQLATQSLAQVTIGSLKLQIADKIALLKNQFMYTTQNTNLTDKNNKPINDYVLICQLRDDGTIEDGSLGSSLAGLSNNQKAGIVSVITGHVFNGQSVQQSTYPNAFSLWLQEHGPLHSTLQQAITETQKMYIDMISQPFTFGALELLATSPQEIENGQFIYTTTAPQLSKEGIFIKDAQGKQLADYYMFVQENSAKNNIIAYNLPHTKDLNYALSLVSGNVYDGSIPNAIIDSGYSFNDYIASFEKIVPLRSALKDAITTAQQAYNAQPTKGSPGTNNTNQAQGSDVSNHKGPQQGSAGTDTKITPTSTADQSLVNNQQAAGNDDECFGC